MKQCVGEVKAVLTSFGALGVKCPGWDSQLSNFRVPKRDGMVLLFTDPHGFIAMLLSLGRGVCFL